MLFDHARIDLLCIDALDAHRLVRLEERHSLQPRREQRVHHDGPVELVPREVDHLHRRRQLRQRDFAVEVIRGKADLPKPRRERDEVERPEALALLDAAKLHAPRKVSRVERAERVLVRNVHRAQRARQPAELLDGEEVGVVPVDVRDEAVLVALDAGPGAHALVVEVRGEQLDVAEKRVDVGGVVDADDGLHAVDLVALVEFDGVDGGEEERCEHCEKSLESEKRKESA